TPLVNALECLLNVLNRICDAESDVSLAVAAKRGTRQARYSGLLQQSIGKFLRLPSCSFDIGKHVASAVRHLTTESSESIYFAYHQIAPAAKFLHHLINRGLVSVQRLDSSDLRKTCCAGIRIRHQTRDL